MFTTISDQTVRSFIFFSVNSHTLLLLYIRVSYCYSYMKISHICIWKDFNIHCTSSLVFYCIYNVSRDFSLIKDVGVEWLFFVCSSFMQTSFRTFSSKKIVKWHTRASRNVYYSKLVKKKFKEKFRIFLEKNRLKNFFGETFLYLETPNIDFEWWILLNHDRRARF